MDKTKIDIPKDKALQLCTEIRQQYQGKWWTLAGIQCMGCNAASKGDMAKRCVSNAPGFRGCNQVNACLDHQVTETSLMKGVIDETIIRLYKGRDRTPAGNLR